MATDFPSMLKPGDGRYVAALQPGVVQLSRSNMAQAAEVFREAFDQQLPWLAGRHTPEQDRAFFEGVVFDACEVWGAFGDGTLLGFIALRGEAIEHLYVLPAQQRRGLGRAMVGWVKARRSRLSLWTFQRNAAARRFYEAEGFIAGAATEGDNEEGEPDIRYVWQEPSPQPEGAPAG